MKLQQIRLYLSIFSVIYFFSLSQLCDADFMCGSGWMYVNTFPGKCLKLFTSPQEFEDARKKCWDNGGQLMTMLETINQLIFGESSIREHRYWIGLKCDKEDKENDCQWIRDMEMKNTTKPIDEDKYLCGTVDKNRRLNYLSCSEKSSFICETNPECDKITYGAKCSKRCSPYCGGQDKACNKKNGSCVYGCVDGYQGELCDRECGKNMYGAKCSKHCSPYCGGRDKACKNINGSCIGGCVDGYQGQLCDRKCGNKTYGVKCSKLCSPYCGGEDKACNNMNGSCVYGCVDGYQGELCDRECGNNTYGAKCSKHCSPFCGGKDKACNNINGSCVGGCVDGYQGELCGRKCDNKTYGVKCSKRCSPYCGGEDKACNNMNGSCVYGCVDGFEGELCDRECENNSYGANCLENCSPYCAGANNTCDKINGTCLFGCVHGYQGAWCNEEKPNETQSVVDRHKTFIYSHEAIISSILFVLAVLSAFLLLPKVRSAEERLSRYTSSMEQEDQF
ncbi:hypothetical protein RRG08_048744 [Elysia crispata]|uniref:C-type lectin domain-containing protein n=1 Tax=Elysia crispata TaxID=231223 RepID=A0AAE0Z0T4_9GAST|nr:hypothetical protein RRG08_048744 [Elysia crispata]